MKRPSSSPLLGCLLFSFPVALQAEGRDCLLSSAFLRQVDSAFRQELAAWAFLSRRDLHPPIPEKKNERRMELTPPFLYSTRESKTADDGKVETLPLSFFFSPRGSEIAFHHHPPGKEGKY